MKLHNPQTFAYAHPNFGEGTTKASLNQNPDVGAHLSLIVEAPDGRRGEMSLQFQDNGNVIARLHLDPAGPIHALIVDGTGTLFEA